MEKLQITLIIGALVYLFIIFWMLKKNKMSIRYSLLWLASAVVLLLFACFPYLAKVLRAITGVEVVSNLIFLLVIIFMLFILGQSVEIVSTAGCILMFLQLIPLIAVIPHTEKALHNTFDKDGKRKDTCV